MKSLYRRYRPLTLEDVVGQEQATKALTASLKQGKIGHAYLFIGPRGTGKTSVARILAHEVNGFKYELEDDYVDIIEIDGASNRGIDNIRELREKAAVAPTKGKYKIYIIDEVHMLTKEAFNALLKTLEEPPRHVIFIMATTDAHKVPVTIVSRAQSFNFRLADYKTMFNFLQKVAKAEKIKISDEALKIIVKKGGGSFRDSLSLLEQISTLSDQEISKEMVVSAMGLPEDEKIAKLLDEYTQHNQSEEQNKVSIIAEEVKNLISMGVRPEVIAEEVINFIIETPKPELMPLLEKLPEVKEPFAEARLLAILIDSQKPSFIKLETPGKQKVQPIPTTKPKEVTKAPESEEEFDWDSLLGQAKEVSEVIYTQLTKCKHEVIGGVLHLYPRTKIIKNILDSKNNKKLLAKVTEDIKIVIHEAGERPESVKNDATLRKISDIMGGEVIDENGGHDPF